MQVTRIGSESTPILIKIQWLVKMNHDGFPYHWLTPAHCRITRIATACTCLYSITKDLDIAISDSAHAEVLSEVLVNVFSQRSSKVTFKPLLGSQSKSDQCLVWCIQVTSKLYFRVFKTHGLMYDNTMMTKQSLKFGQGCLVIMYLTFAICGRHPHPEQLTKVKEPCIYHILYNWADES